MFKLLGGQKKNPNRWLNVKIDIVTRVTNAQNDNKKEILEYLVEKCDHIEKNWRLIFEHVVRIRLIHEPNLSGPKTVGTQHDNGNE